MEPVLDIPPQFILMILVIAVLAAGCIALALVYYFFRARSKKQRAAEKVAMTSGSAGKIADRAAAIPQPPAAADLDSYSTSGEILKVLRGADNSLMLQMEGKVYRSINEIGDPQTGQRLLLIIGDMLAFSHGMIATSDGLRRFNLGGKASGFTAMPSTAFSPMPSATQWTESKSTAVPESGDQALKLIDEIDEYVQLRLNASPFAQKVSLQLRPGFNNELIINLNGRHYHSPAEVPDEDIRALIQAAVKDWEKERG